MIPPSRPLGIANAIATGWLVVNVPVLLIMLASLVIGWAVEPTLWWLFFSAGVILAWTWWSHSVRRTVKYFVPLSCTREHFAVNALCVGRHSHEGVALPRRKLRVVPEA